MKILDESQCFILFHIALTGRIEFLIIELMRVFISEFNVDQLDKLADLFFDLAKAAFILALISPSGSPKCINCSF